MIELSIRLIYLRHGRRASPASVQLETRSRTACEMKRKAPVALSLPRECRISRVAFTAE